MCGIHKLPESFQAICGILNKTLVGPTFVYHRYLIYPYYFSNFLFYSGFFIAINLSRKMTEIKERFYAKLKGRGAILGQIR